MRKVFAVDLRLLAGGLLAACSVYEAPGLGGSVGGAGGGAGMGGLASAGGDAASSGAGVTNGGVQSGGGGGVAPGGTAAMDGTAGHTGGTLQAPLGDGGAAGQGGASIVEQAGQAGQGGAPPAVVDACPTDPDKEAAGVCGCGIPDVSTATLSSCTSLASKLVHRYDFEGADMTVIDQVGTADGTVIGATLSKVDGRGVVLLGGGKSGAYVDLPNRLASSLGNATFEAWITWGGGDAWQRIFDFGDSTHATPENNPLEGKTYLFVSPQIGSGRAALGYSVTGNAMGQELDVMASTSLTLASLAQIVAVVNDAADRLTLYINGVKASEAAWSGSLSGINDVNVWLGRSQYQNDPRLSAVFHEFRVYDAALTAAEVATAFRAGTDPAFLAK